MHVVRDTSDQLILANRPLALGAGLALFILTFAAAGLLIATEEPWFGLMFGGTGVLLGAAAFAAFVRRTQVILDRTSGRILIRHRSVFGCSDEELPLHGLTGAELETTVSASSDGSRATLCRPVLMLGAGPHPIVNSYSSTSGPRRLVDAVNRWLDRGGASDSSPRGGTPAAHQLEPVRVPAESRSRQARQLRR